MRPKPLHLVHPSTPTDHDFSEKWDRCVSWFNENQHNLLSKEKNDFIVHTDRLNCNACTSYLSSSSVAKHIRTGTFGPMAVVFVRVAWGYNKVSTSLRETIERKFTEAVWDDNWLRPSETSSDQPNMPPALEQFQTDIASLGDSVEDILREYNNDKTILSGLRSDIDETRESLGRMRSRLRAQDGCLVEFADTVSRQQTTIVNQKAKISDLVGQVSTQKTDISNLKAQLAEKDARVVKLEETSKKLEEKYELLDFLVGGIDTAQANNGKEVERLKETVETFMVSNPAETREVGDGLGASVSGDRPSTPFSDGNTMEGLEEGSPYSPV